MNNGPRNQQRGVPAGHRDVADRRPGIDHENGAGAHYRQLAAVADLGSGIFVDADAEQVRRTGHQRHQPAVAGSLVEVLVDDDSRQQAQAGGQLADALARGHAISTQGDHELAHDRGSGRRTSHDGAAGVRSGDCAGQRRPDEKTAELELVAARHEHAGGTVDGLDQCLRRGGRP